MTLSNLLQNLLHTMLEKTHRKVFVVYLTICQNEFKACVRYFSLFLKEHGASWLFRTKYFEKKFNLQWFYLPIISRTFFSPAIPRTVRILKTCFEKITACVMEAMLVTLPVVQTHKARREMNQQIKPKSRQENADHFSNREELETTNVV